MRVFKVIWLALVLAVPCGICLRAQADAVVPGSNREQAIAVLGQPQGSLRQGASELLIYKDVEVQIVSGRVVNVRRLNDTLVGRRSSAPPKEPSKLPAPTPVTAAPAVTAPKPAVSIVTNHPPRARPMPTPVTAFRGLKITPARWAIIIPGVGLALFGSLVAIGASIWLIVRAFGVSVGWGLACLFIPFAQLVFLFRHWEEGRKPFLVSLGGAAGAGLGCFLAIALGVMPARNVRSAGALPAGVIQEGSLTNEILMRDAMTGVAAKAAILGCGQPDKIQQCYVLSMPEGEPGKKCWKERWIIAGCGREYPMDLVFRQDGRGSAEYEVQSAE